MRPPPRPKTDFERIPSDVWISGIIEEVMYDMAYKRTWQGEEKIGPAIRFKFKLEGLEHPHYSRWMSFTYGAKANLYVKYLKNLIENAQPDMDFDLDQLRGFKIKTMWTANGDFDNLEQIRAVVKFGAGVALAAQAPLEAPEPPAETIETAEDQIPY